MYRFDGEKLNLPDSKWKERLDDEAFSVLRNKGTEPPFDNAYYDCKKEGYYVCKACGLPLFSSEAKYDSGTGWPSFWEPVFAENVSTDVDYEGLDRRIEVHCSCCKGHLGHVFEDGPQPSGKRYCMNSAALKFIESSV
jgi:peptide-methionine (R)-S-oxide reductase